MKSKVSATDAGATTPVAKTKNKGGRPKGRRNNLTLLKESEMKKALALATSHMIEHVPALVTKLVQQANDGDMQAMKMIFDRVIPTRKAVEHIGSTERPTLQVNITTTAEPVGQGPFGLVLEGEATRVPSND